MALMPYPNRMYEPVYPHSQILFFFFGNYVSVYDFVRRRKSWSSYTNAITNTRLFKYTKKIQPKKGKISNIKYSAQNINCGYSIEPPQRGGSNENHNLCF